MFSLLLLCFVPLCSEVLQPRKNWGFRWVFLTLQSHKHFPTSKPLYPLWLLSFVTLLLVQSQLSLVSQEIKVQGLGAVSWTGSGNRRGEDWSVSCSHWKAAAWCFAGATEMAVFLSGLVQVSSKDRNLPCYPCVFHTLLNLLSSCPCPIPRFLVLQLGIDNGLTWCICSTF